MRIEACNSESFECEALNCAYPCIYIDFSFKVVTWRNITETSVNVALGTISLSTFYPLSNNNDDTNTDFSGKILDYVWGNVNNDMIFFHNSIDIDWLTCGYSLTYCQKSMWQLAYLLDILPDFKPECKPSPLCMKHIHNTREKQAQRFDTSDIDKSHTWSKIIPIIRTNLWLRHLGNLFSALCVVTHKKF